MRDREALIMDAIFNSHELFETKVINPGEYTRHGKPVKSLTIEGGDFQVAREDVFCDRNRHTDQLARDRFF